MAEVLSHFDTPLTDERGITYMVKVCGRVAEDGLWEGWIEFHPVQGDAVLRTPRETEQPNRPDLEYWASGLSVSYLEGALDRARRGQTPPPPPQPASTAPAYDGPASASSEASGDAVPNRVPARAVLDPFDVYSQGEDVLREELSALDDGHLRNIIRAYRLEPDETVDLRALGRDGLSEMIVTAVREQAG